MAGLTPEGFTIETAAEIRVGIVNQLAGFFGISPDALGDDSFDGHLIGIVSERLGKLWEMGRLVHAAFDPDRAQGTSLHGVGAITGTAPIVPFPSTVSLTLTGSPTTVVAEGTRAKEPDTNIEWETLAEVTLNQNTAWTGSTAYALGARRRNANRIYQAVLAGTSAATGGPDTDADTIQDGTVVWRFLGDGNASADVPSATVDNGRFLVLSGRIREIVTPVGGLQGVINLLDAVPGVASEKDESFRIRREQELGGVGSGTPGALQAGLRKIPGVSAATVFSNVGDSPDEFGVPAHHIEALVTGGAHQAIIDFLGANVGGGIGTFGTETGSHIDSQGNVHDVAYSRPETIDIWITVELEKNRLTYLGDAAVLLALLAYGNNQLAGRDVDPDPLTAAVMGVTGVFRIRRVAGVPQLFIGTAPAPTGTAPIVLTQRQQALYDSSRIMIISRDGTP